MKLSTDINCFYGVYSIEETIDMISEAGFDAIDFSFMDKKYFSGEASASDCKSHYGKIKKYARDKGLVFTQAHSPCPSSAEDDNRTEILFEYIIRSMRNASYLGADKIVVHPKEHIDYNLKGASERLFEMNMEFYNRLRPYCEEYNIRIALENLPRTHNFPEVHKFFGCHRVEKSVCATSEEFNRYLDNLDKKWFVACLDMGHAMITGQSPEEMIYSLGGERLAALHIHDNNGIRDMHTLPYLGGMADWEGIMKALKSVGYRGDLSFEAGNFMNQLPRELFPAGVSFMAAIGRQLMYLAK